MSRLLPPPDLILPNGAHMWAASTLPQGSEAWLQARSGIPTASEFATLLVAGKGPHGLGAGAITYAHQVVAEMLHGGPVTQSFENEHTRRGHAMEAEFREVYEIMHDTPVQEAGFIVLYDTDGAPLLGYSPDGLVGDDGLYEGKAPGAGKQVGFLMDPAFPKEYRGQCIAGLLVTGRSWIDLNTGWGAFPVCTRKIVAADVPDEMAAALDATRRFKAYVQEVYQFVNAIAGSQDEAVQLALDMPVAADDVPVAAE